MKKNLLLLLGLAASAAMLFSGCGKKDSSSDLEVNETLLPVETQDAELFPTEEDEASAEQSQADDMPPREGMARSGLTGEWVDVDVANTRPIAVMIPNSKTASYYGLSKAGVLYECNVEATMTRLMAIFEDWEGMDKIGNIRSSRDYFIYWSFEWDAIYVHFGGPFYIDDLVARKDTQNIDCLSNEAYYFQSPAKNDTDCMFTDGERIQKAMERLEYPKEYRADYADAQHFLYSADSDPNTLEQYPDAISAGKVDMSLAYPITNCYFLYNEETGLYDRYQHLSGDVEGPHLDMANNEQLTFKNLIIQNTYYEVRDQKGYLAFQCHDTTRDGWYFTNGKGIHVTWEKTSDYSATRYYDDDGNEIRLNTGKTMICIVEDGDSFQVDNKTIISNRNVTQNKE